MLFTDPQVEAPDETPVEEPTYVDRSIDTGAITVEENEPVAVDAEPEVAEEPEKDSFGGRIKELTDKVRTGKTESDERARQAKAESDARIFEIQAENESLRKELESRPAVQETVKTLDDFDYDEGKYRAYLDDRTYSISAKAVAAEVRKFKAEAVSQNVETSFRKREAEFESQTSDYAAAVYGEVNGQRGWGATDKMVHRLKLSDIGPQMTYYLAKNPDVAAEIEALPNDETVARMARLEFDLKSEMSKKPKTVSDAPPPPPTIKSGDAGMSKRIDSADLSDAEFARMRRKQIQNR